MAAPTFFAVGDLAAGTATSLNVTLPASIQANDIIVIIGSHRGTGPVTITATDYTSKGTLTASGGVVGGNFLWKRAAGTEGGSTVSVGYSGGTASQGRYGIAFVIRGAISSGDPFDLFINNDSAASTTVTWPTGQSTTVDETLTVLVAHYGDNGSAGTSQTANMFTTPAGGNLSGVTERKDACTATGNDIAVQISDGTLATAGAIGNYTCTVTPVTSQRFHATILSFKPTVGGGEATTKRLGLLGVG